MRPKNLIFLSALAVLAVSMFVQSNRTKADGERLTFTDHVTYVSDGDQWVPSGVVTPVSDSASFESFHVNKCSCDCPTAGEIRQIVREELQAFKSSYQAVAKVPAAAKQAVEKVVECSDGQCRLVERPVASPVVTTYTTGGGSSGVSMSYSSGGCTGSSVRYSGPARRLIGRLFGRR